MNYINLRKKTRISYYEPEEPPLDDYIYCEKCKDFVYEYCSIHGPLLVIPDDKVPGKTDFPSFIPRAALTIPHVFLHLARSYIPGAGLGVFSTLTLPQGVRFGPYEGKFSEEATSSYCWQLYDGNNRPTHVVDAADANTSNWMRFVNCSRYWEEQNLVAYQYQGQLYYRTMKIIPRFTELLVFYGSEFAHSLSIDVKLYNSPSGYSQRLEELEWNATCLKDMASNAPQLQRLKTEANSEETQRVSTQELLINDQIFIQSLPKEEISKTRIETLASETEKTEPFAFTAYLENTPKTFRNDNDVVNIKTKFICDFCHKHFDDKLKLIEHIQCHSRDTKELYLRCKECSITFIYNSDFQKHQKLHDKNRPHACHICQRRYSEMKILLGHLKTHEEKTKVCPLCPEKGKYFTFRNLNRHLKTHGSQKKFQCSLCSRSFHQKRYLTLHFETHHDEKVYLCPVCQKSYKQKHSVLRHLKVHNTD